MLSDAALDAFSGALPEEGQFDATRTPAVSSLSLAGEDYSDSSANVSQDAPAAAFAPLGNATEFAIWRFNGTPQDSIGSLDIALSSAEAGAIYWVGVADYSTGLWNWLGETTGGGDAHYDLGGSPGQHSSTSGHIYVAVVTSSAAPFSVASVTIEHLQRYDISGVVLDMQDQPLAGALVTTNLADPQEVLTGPDGGFTLNGIPNGSWAVMAALDGYEFFPAASMVAVSDANVSGVELRGNPQTSGFVSADSHEPNNYLINAYDVGFGPFNPATISILDDDTDYYAFNVTSEGFHYIQFLGDDSILFPTLSLYVDESVLVESSSGYVLYGATWVGYYFQRPGKYYVRVACEGGGGEYELSLHSGPTSYFSCYLGDSGGAGDGDDGLYEELYISRVQLEFAEFTSYLITQGTGTAAQEFVPQLPATIRPVDPLYTFTPEFTQHDFATGDLNSFDFNVFATAPADDMEPNGDKASATPLTLPLAAPVAGWIGGKDLTSHDSYDFFSFEIQESKHVMFRVRFPQNAPADYFSSGELTLRDAADVVVSTIGLNEFSLHERTQDPLPTGTYYLELFMEGTLMPYQLEIYAYDPLYLSAYYELDGAPLDDCNLHFQTADQEINDTEQADDGLAEVNIPFMPGERVYVYHERYGLSFDPAYEWVEFATSDIQLTPLASLAFDEFEPNDSHGNPALVDLPLDLEASIGQGSDYYDYYKFAVETPNSLAITIQTSDPNALLRVRLSKASSPTILYEHKARGNQTFYYRAEDIDDYVIDMYSQSAAEFTYNLSVDKAGFPVYSISGTLDHGEPSESYSGSFIVNHTTGEALEVWISSYLLGYYPDGDYQVQWQIANRSISPAGKTTVTIAGADEVLDYTAVYNDKDSHEPNNSSSTAALVAAPISVSASFDDDSNYHTAGYDSVDYYKFVAPSDGLFEIMVTPQENSPARYFFELSEGTWYNEVNYGKLNAAKSARMARWNVIAGETYFVKVNAYDDMLYMLDGDYVP